ncbi:MAG: Rieske (2Fe-2S) protein [Rhodocyclales bacterium GT-UBC]|nr:MAG: Rieske (2Fe-2S) protein [Rhodocyclales bacterium GT-UBC]
MDWQDLPNAPLPGTCLCRLEEIADGGARMLDLGEGNEAFRLIILRSGEQVHAYLNRCAHFGVPLAQRPEHLIFTPHESLRCNVHYARYHWQSGHCITGECAGEHLISLPLTIQDGNILVAGT